MAQAAPPSRGPVGRAGTTDLLSGRAHRAAKVAVPVLTGLVYGYWAAANRRDAGPVTGSNLLFGFLTALAFALAFMALLALAPKLRREMHAVLWAAFSGIAVGFLFNQAAGSVLRSTALGLAVAAGVFGVMFYRFYTHEDATGHPTG
ncbi:hypothetical protein [Streptomyces griseoloalbus]|uniref:Small-conductance mechanosensitive channel n=1 Tax=Streptomyces griseoloalbus TaxID=67303 RepID=A0A7W8FB08_9ACTN|nr:hypothetical protein [Streptomyces albaduncus]MBB5129768.1 small-conductance mechanosensitive channel [Streptomyces albaduncus]GGW62527.1 hypothetical protein GCM10010340_46100 [Streptomyces albaduncus]